MNWLLLDLMVFVIVVAVAGIIIPQILLISFRKKLFDEIDPRKIHKQAVPRLGGIAFFPSILLAVFFAIGFIERTSPELLAQLNLSTVPAMCFILCAVVILYLVGMADDLIGVKYRAKFLAQIVSAALVVIGGVYISNLHGFLWIGEIPYVVAVLLTILLIVFITNAFNLIDGIDGLASGLSAIASGFYGFIFLEAGLPLYAMLAFATLGALVPFFYYNVFGDATKQKKIFMGDTGALTIGLILSVLSLRITQLDSSVLEGVNPAVVAFAPLLVPCFDVVRVYLHRLRAHRNPFLPDKAHIHHKLLALGITQRLAMPMIVAGSLLLTVANYFLSSCVNISLLFALDLIAWTLVNIFLTRAIRRRESATNSHLYD